MKKYFALLLCSVMALTGCSGSNSDKKQNVIKVYNWGEYTGEDLIQNFEDEYDAKVICEYFDSNEMMYTKLQAGDKYDVIFPSDYMIERLMREDYLSELDIEKIPNIENITDGLKNREYDPENKYSIPYFWGTVGIVYNKNNVSLDDLEKKGWEILRDTRYAGDVYIYDSERDAFMIALKALGYSMNTENEDEIQKAYNWLVELNNTMEPAYVTDEVIDSMSNSMKSLAVVYSGDASYILSENKDMGYFIPEEGTNIWSDAMVIPANAENPELAHQFINYVLSYEAAYDNSEYVGYTSSNDEVLKDMSSEFGYYYQNEAYIPRIDNENDEIFHDNEVLRAKLSELWIKVKAAK